MEIRYPIIFFIIIITITCNLIFIKKKETKYKTGTKIANTHYLKNSDYFQKKLKQFKILKIILLISFGITIITSAMLLSRLSKTDTINTNQYNRDIYLCMDVSASVDELNMELVETLKNSIDKLNGERFGISIFNTSSVVLVPLTEDYDYIKDILDKIKISIQANNSIKYGTYKGDDYFYVINYINSGTLEGSQTRGSSLIGDGLASCVYSFSNLNEDRTRIIILSTDNDLAGSPIVTLDKAAKISKSKNIKVFGIGTKLMKNENKQSLKSAVEKTGGKYYEHSKSTVNNIVDDIEKTSKSLLKNQYETKKIDIPQIPFILLLLSLTSIIIISKKVTKWDYSLYYQYG